MALAVVLIEILRMLTWTPNHVKPEQLVFNTREEMAKVWLADGGKIDEMPAVNWDKEMALAVFSGEKRSGGYETVIEAAVQTGKNLTVLYRESVPPKGSMQTRQLTFPAGVAVIQKGKYERIEFVNVESEKGKEHKAALNKAGIEIKPKTKRQEK